MLIGTIGFGITLQGAAVLIWGSEGQAVPTPIKDTPIDIGGVTIRSYDVLVLGAGRRGRGRALPVPRAHQGRYGDAGSGDGPRRGDGDGHRRRRAATGARSPSGPAWPRSPARSSARDCT